VEQGCEEIPENISYIYFMIVRDIIHEKSYYPRATPEGNMISHG
jgi:hypothetical protein